MSYTSSFGHIEIFLTLLLLISGSWSCTVDTFIYVGDRKELPVAMRNHAPPLGFLEWKWVCFVFRSGSLSTQTSRCRKMINCCGGFSLCATGAVWISPFCIAVQQCVLLSGSWLSQQHFSIDLVLLSYWESNRRTDAGRLCHLNCSVDLHEWYKCI